MSRSVGVLFVHGIGKQSPGMTLSSMGDPLIEWIRDWSRGHDAGDLTLLTTVEKPDAPLHVEAEWTDEGEQRKPVLAECWWAESFAPPSLRQVLLWAPLVAWKAMFRMGRYFFAPALALLIILYVVTVDPILGVVWAILGILLTFALVLPIILVLVFLLLRILPGTGWMATALGEILTGHVGDAWVLRGSETRFAAMRSRCLSDLAWLSEECDRIVVVAHSQGSVIAAETLEGTDAPRCDVFITVGSAIRLLRVPGDDPVQRIRQRRPNMKWLNVYSQLDPVSAGPIAEDSAFPVEILTQNAGSALAAHVKYSSNKEGFQSVVLAALRHVARLDDRQLDEPHPDVRAFDSEQEREFQFALQLRQNRFITRSIIRSITPALSPGLALLALHWDWPRHAQDLVHSTRFIPDWVASFTLRGIAANHGAAVFAGIAALALAMTFQALAIRAAFRWWDRRATRQLAEGRPSRRILTPFALVVASTLPLFAASILGIVLDGNNYWWAWVGVVVAVVVIFTALAASLSEKYQEVEYEDTDFLRRHLSPAFAAFAPNIFDIEGAHTWRQNTRLEAVADALVERLGTEIRSDRHSLGDGERAIELPGGAVATLLPASFYDRPQSDPDGVVRDVPSFATNLAWRKPADVFVLVDVTTLADEPDLEASGAVDLARYEYYLVTDQTIGTRSISGLESDVTREDLVAAQAGPLRLDELELRVRALAGALESTDGLGHG